jgi:hypothetical protein
LIFSYHVPPSYSEVRNAKDCYEWVALA